MSNNPDQIRADIEVTRDELGRDVDALADKVSPPKIMERQKTRAREAFGDMKGRVMGVSDDIGDSAASAGHSVGDANGAAGETVTELPHKARQATQGAPIVVGLLAAGFGFLVASLIPTTDAERRMAASVRDNAQPLMDGAREVAEGLKEPAKDAVEQVTESAMSSAETVKEEVQATAEQVKETVAPSDAGSPSSDDTEGWHRLG